VDVGENSHPVEAEYMRFENVAAVIMEVMWQSMLEIYWCSGGKS
jgi:hypothetical protein